MSTRPKFTSAADADTYISAIYERFIEHFTPLLPKNIDITCAGGSARRNIGWRKGTLVIEHVPWHNASPLERAEGLDSIDRLARTLLETQHRLAHPFETEEINAWSKHDALERILAPVSHSFEPIFGDTLPTFAVGLASRNTYGTAAYIRAEVVSDRAFFARGYMSNVEHENQAFLTKLTVDDQIAFQGSVDLFIIGKAFERHAVAIRKGAKIAIEGSYSGYVPKGRLSGDSTIINLVLAGPCNGF